MASELSASAQQFLEEGQELALHPEKDRRIFLTNVRQFLRSHPEAERYLSFLNDPNLNLEMVMGILSDLSATEGEGNRLSPNQLKELGEQAEERRGKIEEARRTAEGRVNDLTKSAETAARITREAQDKAKTVTGNRPPFPPEEKSEPGVPTGKSVVEDLSARSKATGVVFTAGQQEQILKETYTVPPLPEELPHVSTHTARQLAAGIGLSAIKAAELSAETGLVLGEAIEDLTTNALAHQLGNDEFGRLVSQTIEEHSPDQITPTKKQAIVDAVITERNRIYEELSAPQTPQETMVYESSAARGTTDKLREEATNTAQTVLEEAGISQERVESASEDLGKLAARQLTEAPLSDKEYAQRVLDTVSGNTAGEITETQQKEITQRFVEETGVLREQSSEAPTAISGSEALAGAATVVAVSTLTSEVARLPTESLPAEVNRIALERTTSVLEKAKLPAETVTAAGPVLAGLAAQEALNPSLSQEQLGKQARQELSGVLPKGTSDQQVNTIVQNFVGETRTIGQGVEARQNLNQQVSATVQDNLVQAGISQTSANREFAQRAGDIIVANQLSASPEPPEVIRDRVVALAQESNISLNESQAGNLVNRGAETARDSVVAVGLATAAAATPLASLDTAEVGRIALERSTGVLEGANVPAETVTAASPVLARLATREALNPSLSPEQLELRVRQELSGVLPEGDSSQQVDTIVQNFVGEVRTLGETVSARQNLNQQVSVTVQENLVQAGIPQTSANREFAQRAGDIIVANQLSASPEPPEVIKGRILTLAQESNISLNDLQANDLVRQGTETARDSVVAVGLVAASSAAILTPNVPLDLQTNLNNQIETILREQGLKIDDPSMKTMSERIGQAVTQHYALSPSAKATDLQVVIEQVMQTEGKVPYTGAMAGVIAQRITDLPSAQVVNTWIQTESRTNGVLTRPQTATELYETTRNKFIGEVHAALVAADPSLRNNPDIRILSERTADHIIAQVKTEEGWKIDRLTKSVDAAFQEKGVGLGENKVKTLLTNLRKSSAPTIARIEGIGSPLPDSLFTNSTSQPTNIPLAPLYFILNPADGFRMGRLYLQQRAYATSRWALLKKAPESTHPEIWTLMARDGIFLETIDNSLKTYEAKLPKNHPTIQLLQKYRGEFLKVQKDAGGVDLPGVQHLKKYWEYNLTRSNKVLQLKGIPLPNSFVRPLGTSGYSLQIRNFVNRLSNNRFFQNTRMFPGQMVRTFSIPTRFARVASFGRFSSFGGMQAAFFQNTIGRFTSFANRFGAVQNSLSRFAGAISSKLGMVSNLKTKAIETGIRMAGNLLAVATGGASKVLAEGLILANKIANALGIDTRKLGQGIAMGIAAAGLGAMAIAGGVTALGAGLLALGAGSLAAMTPAITSGIASGISSAASGASSFFSSMGVGSFAAMPVALAVGSGLSAAAMTTFWVVMIAAGAFIVPAGGKFSQWEGFLPPDSPPPVITPPAGVTFTWPISGAHSCSSNFGWGWIDYGGGDIQCRYHRGIDIPGSNEVFAVAPGKIHDKGSSPDAYGNYIIVDHGGFYSLYGHLTSVTSKPVGADVYPFGAPLAERLGISDMGGVSTGNHLHLAFSDCGLLSCFGDNLHSPDPCASGLTCPPGCGYQDRASGCP